MWKTVVVCAALLAVVSSFECVRRPSVASGEDGGHYCVCNSTYCDTAPLLLAPATRNIYKIVTSSKSGLRFKLSQGVYGNVISVDKEIGTIHINPLTRYQEIFGFGGAVTDSVGSNIRSLSHSTQDKLIKSYFGDGSIEYNMIRTPMGGSDFSDRPYSYAMVPNDTSLKYFRLQPEDINLKIPVMQRAVKLSNRYIKFITAPWSPSPWMKTNNAWKNTGTLRREYNQVWADYFVKYFKAYHDKGFNFWGLTPQNEPEISTYLNVDINGLTWTRIALREWVLKYLAPTLNRAGFGHLKIFVGDENRQTLPDLPKTMMNDAESRKVFAGTAVHWYFDKTVPASKLDETYEALPDKPIIYTEACHGPVEVDPVILGSWKRGERYASDIIENLNHWVSSWIDWNIVLNLQGGPTYINNLVDSPILVNDSTDEFYKQPMYYALGHFSKYIEPGSFRIDSTAMGLTGVEHVAFRVRSDSIVVVLLNKNSEETDLLIKDPKKGMTRLTLPPKSINTVKYWL